jgi:4-hydroxy-tetrahydrodipicolinate synthase
VLALTIDEVGDRLPVVNGVYADGSHLAARVARMADRGGASCLLVFPPNSMAMGGRSAPRWRSPISGPSPRRPTSRSSCSSTRWRWGWATHSRRCSGWSTRCLRSVRSRTGVPIRLCMSETSAPCRSLPHPVTVLSTHSSWLMSSLVMGCGGLLSGAGSVAADLQGALSQSVQAKDLARAQAVNERLYPLQQAFYAPPFLDMHNRMKEALVLLGRMERAVVRPPGQARRSRDRAAAEGDRAGSDRHCRRARPRRLSIPLEERRPLFRCSWKKLRHRTSVFLSRLATKGRSGQPTNLCMTRRARSPC